jgi:hypothetical protein
MCVDDSLFSQGKRLYRCSCCCCDGRSAAREVQKLIDNPGLCWEFISGPLARLQLARAERLMSENESARKSYEGFLSIWQDADSDLPIYRQAKAEYAQLQESRHSYSMIMTLRSAR